MNTWLVKYDFGNRFPEFYLYDRRSRRARFAFSAKAVAEQYQLANKISVDVPTRDGLRQQCYLTIPHGVETNTATGLPLNPIPMVLFVHGGPWFRDFWGVPGIFAADAHFGADRGYLMLQV